MCCLVVVSLLLVGCGYLVVVFDVSFLWWCLELWLLFLPLLVVVVLNWWW